MKIEKDIPLPPWSKYAILYEMEVGDSVLFPYLLAVSRPLCTRRKRKPAALMSAGLIKTGTCSASGA
jgi:hypothetical protein